MRTLKEKLALPIVKIDLACGLNQHEKNDDHYIYIDGDNADGIDIVCDWNSLPLNDGIADVVHFSDAIEHIKTWEADITMGEINRILKLGGIFFGTTPNRDYILKAAYEGLQDEEWLHRNLYGDGNGFNHTHYQTFTKKNLQQFLEKYGFGEVVFDNIEWWISWTCKKIKNLK